MMPFWNKKQLDFNAEQWEGIQEEFTRLRVAVEIRDGQIEWLLAKVVRMTESLKMADDDIQTWKDKYFDSLEPVNAERFAELMHVESVYNWALDMQKQALDSRRQVEPLRRQIRELRRLSNGAAKRRTVRRDERRALLERDHYRCRYCGVEIDLDSSHVDHVYPVAHGGKTIMSNLVSSCIPCNVIKGDKVGVWPRPLAEYEIG